MVTVYPLPHPRRSRLPQISLCIVCVKTPVPREIPRHLYRNIDEPGVAPLVSAISPIGHLAVTYRCALGAKRADQGNHRSANRSVIRLSRPKYLPILPGSIPEREKSARQGLCHTSLGAAS